MLNTIILDQIYRTTILTVQIISSKVSNSTRDYKDDTHYIREKFEYKKFKNKTKSYIGSVVHKQSYF